MADNDALIDLEKRLDGIQRTLDVVSRVVSGDPGLGVKPIREVVQEARDEIKAAQKDIEEIRNQRSREAARIDGMTMTLKWLGFGSGGLMLKAILDVVGVTK